MSVFASILVPLDGSRLAARSLGCATWLAARLGARLHILSATPHELPAREEAARLLVPEEHWPLITLHQGPAYPEGAILAALARYDIGLIVMSAGGQTAEAAVAAEPGPDGIVGHVTRAIIEQSPVPVLLLPPNYRESLPWERTLVPVSGEVGVDEALALAVRLANALDLEVQVAHVADVDTGDEGLAARARYADALHHEYPRQLDEFVSRALPHCSPEECRRIEEVALCHGDAAGELRRLIERKRVSILVIGWRGQFMTGRARVLKQLIQAITTPLLLVRATARMPFRLKVGEEIG
ncbi:MAG TPA: universal stress protein [Candidatus Binatia bacterium]|nr:universal stress protein [Candidatus Binatia bacterium]